LRKMKQNLISHFGQEGNGTTGCTVNRFIYVGADRKNAVPYRRWRSIRAVGSPQHLRDWTLTCYASASSYSPASGS
jgi:hypothetical protein